MSNLDFKLRLDAEINPLKQKLAQAKDEAMRLKQAWENNKSNENAKAAYVQQMGEVTRIQKQISIQSDETSSKVNRLNQTLEQSGHKMTPLASSIGKIGMAAAGAVGGLAALQKGLSDVLAATQEYQAIATRFTYAFDGAEEGAKQLAFVREEAQRLGLEFMGAANGYAQFAAAAKDVNISTEQTQSIFKGVAAAAATMGLSADDANGVFLALSQIAGKGKVSMEELRGQLGERLAPAMSIAAQAMGVTTAELENMVANGLAAETFLPRFGAALEEAFSKDAASNAQSLNGQINLLKNSYNEFLVKLGEGSVGAGMVAVMKDIGAALEFAKAKFDEFSQSENGKLLKQNLSQFYELIKEVGNTVIQVFQIAKDNIEDFAGAFGSAISGSKNEIDLLQTVLDGVNLTIALIRDGVSGASIAFNLFSGAVKDLLAANAEAMSQITWGDWSASLKQMAADLREEADKNYESAHQAALQFESQTAKVWESIEERAQRTKEITEQANQSAKQSVDETAQAAAKTDELSQAYKDAQTAVSGFGLDMRAAMNQATPAMAEAQGNLAKLVAGFDDLQAKGVNASLLLNQALAKMTETASNQADIDALKQSIRDLGRAGKIGFEEVELAILAADMRLQELKGNIDPTEAAFKKLGIQSRESLRLAAEETRLAFERVKSSGQATSDDLKKAFENTANALLATGDSNQQAWVESQAAAYNYKVIVDETGKANIQAAEKTVQAAQSQVAAHHQVAQAAQQATDAQNQAHQATSQSAQQATQAIENQGKKLSELGQKVAHTMQQIGGYRWLGTGAWQRVLRHVQDMYIGINQAVKQLNVDMETGGDIATSLARAEALAISNAHKLDKTTLSNLHAAIDKARAKMQQMADDATATRKQLEKQLLNAKGDTNAVAAMEQQEALDNLNKQREQAQKMGNKQAVAELQKAIELQKQIYQTELQKARQQAEQDKAKMADIAKTPSPVQVNADLSGLIQTMQNREQAVAQQAAQQIVNEINDAMLMQR